MAEARLIVERVGGWRDTRDDDLETMPGGSAHRFCRTKLDFAQWVSAHEMLHAGQIGLIR